MKTVIGIFDNREDATDAIDALTLEGYDAKDISIVMRDADERTEVVEETGATNDVAGSTASGMATGAILGGLAGLIASVAIPGLGAFFIGGPIAAALGLGGAAATTVSGAATGAVAGGLIGALTGLGLSREEAHVYEDRVNNDGAILVAVPARENEDAEVEDILDQFNASDIKSVSASERSEDEEILRSSRRARTPMFAGVKGGESRLKRNRK